MEETVTISKKEYHKLLICELKLDMLEAKGVDNWSGYREALNPEGEQSFNEIVSEWEKT